MAFKLFEAKTKEKAKEDKRQLEYERVLSILNAIPNGVYIVGKQYDIEYINPTIKEQFGPINGRKCYEYFHDRTEVCPWCKHSEIYEGKSVKWNWFSFKNNRYYELFDAPIVNVDGSISKFEIFHDITERKKAEDALKENKELLNSIFTSMQDLIFIIDKNKCFTSFYNTPDSLLYTPSDQFIGKSIYETLPPDVSDPFGNLIDKLFKTGKPQKFDYSLIVNDEINWYSANLNTILNNEGEIISVVTVVRDITERKQVEDIQRENEERFRQIYEHMAVGVAQVSLDFRIKGANEAYCQMLGYSENELIGKHLKDITHPETIKENLQKQSQLAMGEIDHYRMEKLFIHKSGRVINGILDANLIRNNEGNPLYFLGSVYDITEQKLAKEYLAAQKQRLDNILQGSNVGTWEWNIQTGETIFNEHWAEIIGYTLDEISPVSLKTWIEFTHPDDLKKSGTLLEKHFNSELDYYECEIRMRHKNGSGFSIEERFQHGQKMVGLF